MDGNGEKEGSTKQKKRQTLSQKNQKDRFSHPEPCNSSRKINHAARSPADGPCLHIVIEHLHVSR